MRRDNDELPRGILMESPEAGKRARIETLFHVQNRIYAGVSRDGDRGGIHALTAKVAGRSLGCGEVKRGDPAGKHAVHLFGKGLIRIAGAEPRFHMADTDFGVKGRQSAAEGGRSIALNQHHAGALLGKNRFQGGHDSRRGLGKGLTGAHDVKVLVRDHIECAQDLIEHPAMLRGDANTHGEFIRPRPHVPDYRAELDGLGAGTENEENLGQHGPSF